MAAPIPLDRLPVLHRDINSQPSPDECAAGMVIPVDKPEGWSSFDVVRFVRARLPVRKVGHAGTLDPMATGLLLLCCGKATRSVSQIQELEKVYEATVTLGAATPSYDRESGIVERAEWEGITPERVLQVLQSEFTGRFLQVPPPYSALRINGERMYKLARKGEKMDPKPREVVVHGIELVSCDLPEIRLLVRCGKGFYVRSLANDLGRSLGSLGYLSSLRRTATGHFSVEQAWLIEQIKTWSPNGGNDEA